MESRGNIDGPISEYVRNKNGPNADFVGIVPGPRHAGGALAGCSTTHTQESDRSGRIRNRLSKGTDTSLPTSVGARNDPDPTAFLPNAPMSGRHRARSAESGVDVAPGYAGSARQGSRGLQAGVFATLRRRALSRAVRLPALRLRRPRGTAGPYLRIRISLREGRGRPRRCDTHLVRCRPPLRNLS